MDSCKENRENNSGNKKNCINAKDMWAGGNPMSQTPGELSWHTGTELAFSRRPYRSSGLGQRGPLTSVVSLFLYTKDVVPGYLDPFW